MYFYSHPLTILQKQLWTLSSFFMDLERWQKGSWITMKQVLSFRLVFCFYWFNSFIEVIIFFYSYFLRQKRSLLIPWNRLLHESFTGMCNKNLHGVKSRNIIFERCVDINLPRYIDFKLEASKNDRQISLTVYVSYINKYILYELLMINCL